MELLVNFRRLAFTALLSSLAACGGDGDSPPASNTPSSPGLTHVSGAVVKGPVANATVCAYELSGGVKGARLGRCSQTDAAGNYGLDVPLATGLVLLEARGGRYIDETTAAATDLSGTLRSVVGANGASMTAVATPLTTLAVNSALAAGPLNAGSWATHLQSVLTAFSLPATLDLVGSRPDFSATADAYAQALRVVSRMVADGTSLATLLGTTQPALLSAAYADAAAALASGSGGNGNGGGDGGSPGQVSATGTLAVSGGPSSSFAPQADGFEVQVNAEGVKYRFYRDNRKTEGGVTTTLTSYLEVKLDLAGVVRSVAYNDPQTILQAPVLCVINCGAGIAVETPAGATHPVTLRLTNVQLGTLTLNGSLTGDAAGATWRVQDLPRTTDGFVKFNGVDQAIATARYSVISVGGITRRSATLLLSNGATVGVEATDGAPSPVVSYLSGGNIQICVSNCAATLNASGSGVTVAFNGTQLSGGAVLANTVFIGQTQGTLTSSTLGSFSPVKDSVESLNARTTYVFDVFGTSAQDGISMVSVSFDGNVATAVTLTTGIGTTSYQCFKEASSFLGVPACAGLSLGSDRRSVTFANTALGNRQGSVTLNGTLTARGL